MMKVVWFTCLLSLTLTGCLSSPLDITNEGPQTRFDITDAINSFIKEKTDAMAEIITLTEHTEIPILFSNIFDVLLVADNVTLEGLKALSAKDCRSTVNAGGGFDVDMTLSLPILTLIASHYNMEGMVVDTIHLQGDGAMSLIPENLDLRLWGHATGTLIPSITATFDSISIDITMWRWTINFEGLMPGTDLGTVFNEFFTMVGPEMMDLLEIRLNEGTWLLDFVNGIFGGGAGKSFLDSLLKKQ